MYDAHVHTVGSTPLSYIAGEDIYGHDATQFARRLTRAIGLDNGALTFDLGVGHVERTIRAQLLRLRRQSAVKAQEAFFKAYSVLNDELARRIDASCASRREQYVRHYYAILASMMRSGAKRVDLFVSIDPSQVDQLPVRVEALNRVAERLNSVEVAIRLTVPRSRLKRGQDDCIIQCFRHVLGQQALRRRIVGLDLADLDGRAGDPSASSATLSLLGRLRRLRSDASGSGPAMSVTAHFGEALSGPNGAELLHLWDQLLRGGVDAIGHGTFCWIPEMALKAATEYAHLAGYERERRELLLRTAQMRVRFEICPQAELVTQPIRSPADLPVPLFRRVGLRYVVGTDSPALLGTDIHQEHRMLSTGTSDRWATAGGGHDGRSRSREPVHNLST